MKQYPKNFWLLCLSGLLFFASFSMMLPNLPAYLESLGGGSHKGLIIFLFTVSALVSRPFSGKLADEWGRVPVMVLGALVSSLAALFYPFASSIWLFFAIRLFHGFSTGFKPTGTAAYVADIIPSDRRGAAMGIVGFASNLGTALGSAVGPFISQYSSLNTMFMVSSSLGVLSVIVLAGMKETLKNRKKFNLNSLKIKKEDYYEPNVLKPSIALVLTVFTFGGVLTLGPDISKSLFSTGENLLFNNVGTFFVVYVLSSLLVRITAGKLSDQYGRVKVLRFSIPLLIIAALLMGTASTQLQLLIGSIIMGFGIGISSPTIYAWTIDLSHEHLRGRGIATMYIALEAGIGLGAFFTGYLFHLANENFLIPFLLCALLSSLGFVYVLTIKKDKIES